MSQQQTYTIKQGIRLTANVRNNEYLLLMNIDNLQEAQGKEWYESTGSSTKNFLVHLADFVNYNNFSDTGVEKIINRLQHRGYLIMEGLRVQVTEKWRDIVAEYGGYLNHGPKTTEQILSEEDKKLLERIDKGLKELDRPTTLNVREYRKTVNKLVYDGKKAVKRKLKDDTFKGVIDGLDGLLKSDYLLKQYFENALKNNGGRAAPPNAPPNAPTKAATDKPPAASYKSQKDSPYNAENVNAEIEKRSTWQVSAYMREADFIQALKDVDFWFSKAASRGIELTEGQKKRLTWAQNKLANPAETSAYFKNRVAELKAEIDANKASTFDPSVLATVAAVAVKEVKKV